MPRLSLFYYKETTIDVKKLPIKNPTEQNLIPLTTPDKHYKISR